MQFRPYIQPECNFKEKYINNINKMANSITFFFYDGLFWNKAAQSIVIIYFIVVFWKRKIEHFKFSLIFWTEAIFYAI